MWAKAGKLETAMKKGSRLRQDRGGRRGSLQRPVVVRI